MLAVPGALDTPTGGYGYAARLLDEADGVGLALRHLPLPGGFPTPSPAEIDATAARLAATPPGRPILVDGLALGALPARAIRGAAGPVTALCHHPLGLETGLPEALSARLLASERAALALCAGVITTSRTTADLVQRLFDIPDERLAVARPGTDRPASRRSQRHRVEGPVHILSVGSLTRRKGHDTLLAALGRLGALDWRLTIVGAVPDDSQAETLKTLARTPPLRDRVEIRGPVERAALEHLYTGADIFALASRYEGYGMAFAEAMAHGLPVVGCRAGAVAEATDGGARLVPPDDPPALAAALGPLIADAEARHRAAAEAQRAALRLPSWRDTAGAVRAAISAWTAPPAETLGRAP